MLRMDVPDYVQERLLAIAFRGSPIDFSKFSSDASLEKQETASADLIVMPPLTWHMSWSALPISLREIPVSAAQLCLYLLASIEGGTLAAIAKASLLPASSPAR